MRNVNYNRHRRSLQGKATSYILVVVLFFPLTQLLSNGWEDFHQIFTERRLCDAICFNGGTSKLWGLKTTIFGAKIHTPPSSESDGRCAETRRNSSKTKTTGITKISRLLSHPHLVKLIREHLTYRGLISCAF